MKFFPNKLLVFLERDFTLSRRQLVLAMLIILIAGLGLRLSYHILRERQPRDEKLYIETVEKINVNDSHWESEYNLGPLMPQLAAFFCRTGISAGTALRTLNLFYAMSWVLIMFFLCRDVFDDSKAGLIGMTFAAFNPYSIRMASQILREPLYILIFTVSLWLAVRFIKNQERHLFYPLLLAVLTILAFFTRYEGIEISVFLPLAFIVILLQYKWPLVKICIYSFAVYLFTVGIIVGILINFGNIYMCNISQKAIYYFEFFAGNRLK